MNSSNNNYDALEEIIFKQGLRIAGVHLYPDQNLMVVVLNNSRVLQRKINTFNRLENASPEQLHDYRLISDGLGIHWPGLDEDISLKGLLKTEFAPVE